MIVDKKIADKKREMHESYVRTMLLCDIVDDLGFAASKLPSADAVADKILEQAQQRLLCDHLLVGQKPLPQLQNMPVPVVIPWQNADNTTPGHIWISSNDNSVNQKNALDLARNLIVRMLAAFRPGLVRLSFLDPLISGAADVFCEKMKNISELYHKEVKSSREEIAEHIKLLNAKMKDNTPAGAKPCEVVVIFDFQSDIVNKSDLDSIIGNGVKRGIYLLVVSTEMSGQTNYNCDKINRKKFICIKDYSVSYFDAKQQREENFSFTLLDDQWQSLAINGQISPALDRYFEKMPAAFKIWEEKNSVNIDLEQFLKKDFEQIDKKGLTVPIGVSGNEPFHFKIDQEGNTHTFIIGTTGSGKSVLLRDILATAVLKYSPEELNLYLMDFKKGGVEFNAYASNNAKAIPHVKIALLDDCDRQAVLLILLKLEKEMTTRGKLFAKEGVVKLSEYNEKAERNGEKRLPSIILAVEECHHLFPVTRNPYQTKIVDIIKNIATQGRSQGIHLILATQTLTNANIPDEVNNNIANKFVLDSEPSDALKLGIENPDEELKKLDKKGAAIYKTKKMQQIVYPFNFEKDLLAEQMKNVCKKAQKKNQVSQEKQYIFRGSWQPSVDEASFRNAPMTVGLKFTFDEKIPPQLTVPIDNNNGGDNLLIIGNRGQDGEAERNAFRIVIVSLLSLTEYYKQNNKQCRIYIINHSATTNNAIDTDVLNCFSACPYCRFLDGREAVEETFAELLQRINREDTGQPDTYLYILGAQRFRDLKNNRSIKLYDEILQASIVESNKNEWIEKDSIFNYLLQSDSVADNSNNSVSSSAKSYSEISYSKCLEKILDNGSHYGIHVVLQTDKTSNLFVDYNSIRNLFSYMVLLGMPELDASSLTKEDLPTEALPTEEERLKAIFFNDAVSESTTFVPFALPAKEYLEQKINNINH